MLNAPYMLETHRFHSTASMGPTLFHDGLSEQPEGVLKLLRQACRRLQIWQQHRLTREPVLAINVSARQFHQAGFGAYVQATPLRDPSQ